MIPIIVQKPADEVLDFAEVLLHEKRTFIESQNQSILINYIVFHFIKINFFEKANYSYET